MTLFVDAGGGEQWALRHYRRGGMIGRVAHDGYIWTGLERTRPWLEWHLLSALHQRGLPVPRPVAARVQRRGLRYSADILTERLIGTRSLSDHLRSRPQPTETLNAVGACIGRLHRAGVRHGDLTSDNILLAYPTEGDPPRVYVVDFDGSTLRVPKSRWQRANVQRLQRSLKKRARRYSPFYYGPGVWEAILAGYGDGQDNVATT